jgi:glycosyltransferase involved in cell wall biosynthesis
MQSLRILHLVHQYPPEFTGGTELYTQSLARTQIKQGHHAAVFAPSSSSHLATEFTSESDDGLQVYRVPLGERSRTRVFIDTFRKPKIQNALSQVLRIERPDLVHIQHLMGMPMTLAQVLQVARIPYLVTLHDYWYVCANAQLLTNTDQAVCQGPDSLFTNCAQCALARAGQNGLQWLAPSVAPLMAARNRGLRKVLDGAGCVIAPTRFVRQTYADLGLEQGKMVVIPHGINLPEEVRQMRQDASRTSQKEERCLRIGFVGSIAWQKGVHVLVEAANRLPQDSVAVTIYGSLDSFPEYTARLRDMIAGPSINLSGRLARRDLWQALADLDLIVLPALWYETSSLVLDEAFAARVPVVASDIGVLAEKVQDGVNGRLFPPGDAQALRDILQAIIDDPALLEHWQNGIPDVRGIEEHVQQIEELYRSLLDAL